MKKRLISMLLTAGMLVSLVAGCGSKAETPGASGDSNAAGTETASTNGEYPVIRVPYSIVFDSFDADKVEDALNEIMREKAGAEIELVGIEFANWSTQLNLMLTGGELIPPTSATLLIITL